MGCKDSKERVPQQANDDTPEPSSRYAGKPHKPADAATGLTTSFSRDANEAQGLAERPTTSTSQGGTTPNQELQSCRSSAASSSSRNRHPQKPTSRDQDSGSERQTLSGPTSPPRPDSFRRADGASPSPCHSFVPALTFPESPCRDSVTGNPPSLEHTIPMDAEQRRSQRQARGASASDNLTDGGSVSNSKTAAGRLSPATAAAAAAGAGAAPSSLRSTPTSQTPVLVVSPPSALPSLVPMAETPLQLPQPATARNTSVTSSSLVALGPRHSSGFDNDFSCAACRAELMGTTNTLNSTSFTHTFASTQPPSYHASRSTSVQATCAAGVPYAPSPQDPVSSPSTSSDATEKPDRRAAGATTKPTATSAQTRGSPAQNGPSPQNGSLPTKSTSSGASGGEKGRGSSTCQKPSPTHTPVVRFRRTQEIELPADRIDVPSPGSASQNSPVRVSAPPAEEEDDAGLTTKGSASHVNQTHNNTATNISTDNVHDAGAVSGATFRSGDESSTFDGRSSAPTQPPSAMAERRTGFLATPSSPSPKQQHLRLQAEHSRSASFPSGSPRARTPVLTLSPHRLTQPSNAGGGNGGGVNGTTTGTVTTIALSVDSSDAPHDVPLPAMEGLFPIYAGANFSSQTSSQAAVAAAGVNNSSFTTSPSPGRLGNSTGMRSPAGRSLTQMDSESFNYNSTGSNSASAAAAANLTSPFLSNPYSNSMNNNSNTNGGFAASNSNASWLMSGNLNASGMSGANAGSLHGTLGAAATAPSPNFSGSPPTNSELVRQINQSTTNIKSILRKRTSSAATATATPTYHHGAVLTDGDGVTTLGASNAHSRTLSLSLTTGGANGGGHTPRLVMGESRAMHGGSLPDVMLRTDFITTRQTNSGEADTMTPTGPHLLSPPTVSPPLGAHFPPTPPSSSALQLPNPAVMSAPLTLSGETSLSTTVISVAADNGASNTADAADGAADRTKPGSPPPPLLLPTQQQSGGRNGLSGRRSPASRPMSRSPATPNASSSPRRAGKGPIGEGAATPTTVNSGNGGSNNITSYNGGEGSAAGMASSPYVVSAADTAAVGRTSDEPPPDIMLVPPPKRVHLVV